VVINDKVFRLIDLVLFNCSVINNIMGIIAIVNFL